MRNLGFLALAAVLACSCGPDREMHAQAQTTGSASAAVTIESTANQAADGAQVGDHYQTTAPNFWVRPGFKVTQVASGLGNARFMEFDDKGTLYLSRPEAGDVITLKLGEGQYHVQSTYISGLSRVQGLCFKDGWMWLSQSTAILKTRDTNGDGKADEVVKVLTDLPGGTGHWWRSILVTDNTIYSSVGDPENISDQTSTEREKMFTFNLDGSNKKLFASGLRNTEKLLLRPGTQEVWGMDHGSDWYGAPFGDRQGRQPITDLNPPDEFNHYVAGGFYGHPFLIGNRIPRVEYQGRPDIIDLAERTTPPAWCFGAHWAANGFTFYTGSQFPPEYKGDAFCGMHGSWNSKRPTGYRIERVLFDKVTGEPYGSQMIVGTLTKDFKVQARPVDVVQAPDGSLLFTDDKNSAIYRISWTGK